MIGGMDMRICSKVWLDECRQLWYAGREEMTMENINNELDIVSVFVKDAHKYGLTAEVVLFALKYMKDNPESSIEKAMNYGYWEWCK